MAYINEVRNKAKDSITPEERLLKIIESPGIQKAKVYLGAKVKAINIKSLTVWIKGFRLDKNIIKKIDLRLANKIVACLCGLMTLFLLFDFFRVGGNLRSRFEKTLQASQSAITEEKKIAIPNVDIEEVIAQAKRRNVFTFLPEPSKAEASLSPDITEIISNLKLVGIIWSNSPQAMIENSKEQRTFLLSQGEQIGQVTIKNIFKDKVVIEVEGQEKELR